MIKRLFSWLKSSLNYLWLFAAAVYLSISTIQATVSNYRSQQETKSLEQQLTDEQNEKARLEALIIYYQTDSYQEKELRQDFLLQKPGEQVFALPESSASKDQDEVASTAAVSDPHRGVPIWRQWVQFLFSQKNV